MKEPVDHILRPRLPWRPESDPAITECGYDAAKVKAITRDKFFQRLKDLGQQRAALFTCMTCAQTAQRWPTWEDDPRRALEREINWECGWGGRDHPDREMRLKNELMAVAALIAVHQEEFTALVQRGIWCERKTKMRGDR